MESHRREFKKPANVAHASDICINFVIRLLPRLFIRLSTDILVSASRVVEHIGCHYAKMFPHKGVGGAEYLYVLVGMIESWGGEVYIT
jgi:heterodisulfide reductase subunit B